MACISIRHCIKNNSKAEQTLREPTADPFLVCALRKLVGFACCGAVFATSYKTRILDPQNFDSAAMRHSLRMTLGVTK